MAYPFVIVYWRDHHADAGWVDDADVEKATGKLCKSTGYLVRQDAKMTVVVSAIHEEEDGKGCSQEILTCCVEKIVRAEETEVKVRVKK